MMEENTKKDETGWNSLLEKMIDLFESSKELQAEKTSDMPMSEIPSGSYGDITALAGRILEAVEEGPIRIALEADMAKALGQALAVRLPPQTRILCLDRVRVGEDSYLDIGAPVAGAFPVVVKTLVLERRST